jgi:hypothetical protein
MVSSQRHIWLSSHVLDDPEGAAAHAAAVALGGPAHARVLAAGDRLAAVSATLAQRYYRSAAAAWHAFGPEGFERWLTLGEALATREPLTRDGALAFFALAPTGFGRAGLDTATAWCELGHELAATSQKLAAIFFRTSGALLRRADALGRLRHWVDVGIELYGQRDWHGEFLAQAYFAAAPQATAALDPSVYRLWAGAGAALSPTVKERDFFAKLPRPLARWSAAEQALLLRTVIALAAPAAAEAVAFYRALPDALAELPSAVRMALLRVLQQVGAALVGAAGEIAPVTGALLRQVPPPATLDALAQLERVAEVCPPAVTPALRALPRLYESAAPERVREWFAIGLDLARRNADAGLAFFALESRTSAKALRADSTAASLEEEQGLLRKYVQMLSGAPAAIRALEAVYLRPPLEEWPSENEIALPLRIDWLPTHEENQRIYRYLTAQLAGRREFGTYAFAPADAAGPAEAPADDALFRYVTAAERPEAFEDLFLLAEGMRIHHRLCAAYRGLAQDGRWVAARVLERAAAQAAPGGGRSERLDALLAALWRTPDRGMLPTWLDAQSVALVAQCVAPLARPTATVADSLQVAESLAAALTAAAPAALAGEAGRDALRLEKLAGDALLDLVEDEHGVPYDRAGTPAAAPAVPAAEQSGEEARLTLPLSHDQEGSPGGALPISPEELRRLLQQGVDLKISQAPGADVDGLGLFITDLIGKLPSEQIERLRQLLGDADAAPRRAGRRFGEPSGGDAFFAYDEWDYHIADYRSRWCKLFERSLEGDSGEFFTRTLGDYAQLIPEVRRQFQRIRPEMYRLIRGLEDGEDFDLNAAVAAQVDYRAGLAPSSRLYMARQRAERDVAALFLLDMSASTDEPLIPPGLTGTGPDRDGAVRRATARPRRIIDVTKETLVIMAEALEAIGDAYAIYGFSGHGRDRVEVYRVKSFAEALSPAVKARLGGIEPQRSTRMGAALRHAVEKLAAVTARIKHLFLLSDGFPQDYDYGQDRRSNTYGIRDTAVALREAETAGVTPFCITVDKAGHDYLRQMCDESRYMVIEDITALPRELPKIYQRVVRA